MQSPLRLALQRTSQIFPGILLFFLVGCQSATVQPLAVPPDLFREMGYEDAVQLSSKENKPLFLYFDGDWARDRQKLVTKTLANPAIAPLLRDRTITLCVEVVDLPDIAKKHHVTFVPLLVLVAPDGREINRWSGTPKPGPFAKELEALLSGTSAAQYKRTVTKDTDLVARHQFADRLITDGEFAEALQELLWLYNTGIGDEELSNKDLRASTVVRSLGRLKTKYSDAASALVDLRDREKQKALRSPHDTTTGRKLAEILRALADNDSSLALYRELQTGNVRSLVRNMVIIPMFVTQHDYRSAANELSVEQALSAVDDIKEMNVVGRGVARTILLPVAGTKAVSLLMAESQRKILQRRAFYFEVYAGADRTGEARQIASAILKGDRLKQAPAVLRESAQKVCGDRTDAFLQALALPELLPVATPQTPPAHL